MSSQTDIVYFLTNKKNIINKPIDVFIVYNI